MRKNRFVLLLLPLILILAACSGTKTAGTSSNAATTTQQSQSQQGQAPNMANQPLDQKLALGTLKLEGSDKAVTAEQAKTLLPLWKAVKTMSSDSNTSVEEITALYQQIQEAMTSDQVQAIKDLNLSQTDLQALMKTYNIQAPQMGAGGVSGTPRARTQTGSSGGTSGVPQGGDFGGPPPDGAGFPGGGQAGAQGTPIARGTPRAGQAGPGFRGGMNNMFIDSLITILEQRSGVQATPTP